MLSVSRLPGHVDWRLHLEYRHGHAANGPKLAGFAAFQIGFHARFGFLPGDHPNRAVLVIRRRVCGPHSAAKTPAGLAIRAVELRFLPDDSLRHRSCQVLAYPDLVFHRRHGAILWRTGLFGLDSVA